MTNHVFPSTSTDIHRLIEESGSRRTTFYNGRQYHIISIKEGKIQDLSPQVHELAKVTLSAHLSSRSSVNSSQIDYIDRNGVHTVNGNLHSHKEAILNADAIKTVSTLLEDPMVKKGEVELKSSQWATIDLVSSPLFTRESSTREEILESLQDPKLPQEIKTTLSRAAFSSASIPMQTLKEAFKEGYIQYLDRLFMEHDSGTNEEISGRALDWINDRTYELGDIAKDLEELTSMIQSERTAQHVWNTIEALIASEASVTITPSLTSSLLSTSSLGTSSDEESYFSCDEQDDDMSTYSDDEYFDALDTPPRPLSGSIASPIRESASHEVEAPTPFFLPIENDALRRYVQLKNLVADWTPLDSLEERSSKEVHSEIRREIEEDVATLTPLHMNALKVLFQEIQKNNLKKLESENWLLLRLLTIHAQ